jgi:hypothetical protein
MLSALPNNLGPLPLCCARAVASPNGRLRCVQVDKILLDEPVGLTRPGSCQLITMFRARRISVTERGDPHHHHHRARPICRAEQQEADNVATLLRLRNAVGETGMEFRPKPLEVDGRRSYRRNQPAAGHRRDPIGRNPAKRNLYIVNEG